MEGIGERYARDAVTGERYKLPKDTKYNDWAKQYIKDSPPKSQRSNGIFTDVKNEYEKAATPEQGSIKYDTGYNTGKHQDEISVANLLHNTYGGNIRLLNEANDIGVKTPDYNWRGKLWELKTTSTVNATDAAVRKAVKQIQDNPGGIILDYGSRDIDVDALISAIDKRVVRSNLDSVDVLMLSNGKVVKFLRYKK